MTQQSYGKQIEWCDRALNSMEDLTYSLRTTVGDVHATLQYLTTTALMAEDINSIRGFGDIFDERAKEIYMLIQTDNIDYIEAQKNLLLQIANG